MIRPVVQVVRFYIINKGVTSRSIESLMDNPSYNPLLKHCVNTIKRYPDWAIATCKEHMKEVDQKRFKFNSGAWAMDIREEDIPKGSLFTRHFLILFPGLIRIVQYLRSKLLEKTLEDSNPYECPVRWAFFL